MTEIVKSLLYSYYRIIDRKIWCSAAKKMACSHVKHVQEYLKCPPTLFFGKTSKNYSPTTLNSSSQSFST